MYGKSKQGFGNVLERGESQKYLKAIIESNDSSMPQERNDATFSGAQSQLDGFDFTYLRFNQNNFDSPDKKNTQ